MRIAVFNQKGGVGKTTTVINLGASIRHRGETPMLIDLDPQAHLSAIHGEAEVDSDRSVFAMFLSGASLTSLMLPWHDVGNLVPAHAELIKADSIFGKGPDALNKLNASLAEIQDNLQCVLIDCCPFLGVLALNAIFAADGILVPVSSDFLSLRAATQVEHTLKALEPVLKRRIKRRYLITRFDRRRKMSFEIQTELRRRFGTEVCETVISENVDLARAPTYCSNIYGLDASSRGAKDYLALTDELSASGFLA